MFDWYFIVYLYKTGNVRIPQHWGPFVQLLSYGKNSKFYILCLCICSLRYPACNVYAPVILSSVACPDLQYLSTLSHKRYELKKKMLFNKKCLFQFSLQLFSETFLILRRNEWHDQKCTLDLLLNTRYCCRILMKIKFPQQNFEKFSKTKFHENRSSVSRIVPCPRRTDIAKLIVPFCNCANASKMKIDAEIFATSDNTMS